MIGVSVCNLMEENPVAVPCPSCGKFGSHFCGNFIFMQCTHPEHFPPTHMTIPSGMTYVHVCPFCSNVMRFKSDHVATSTIVSKE
jgi:hypothetical protein